MLYSISLICILITNFLYSPHYFLSVFCILKEKIKCRSHTLAFTFLWLAEIAKNTKPVIRYLPTSSHLIRELPQNCEMISKATDLGLIFCPSKKGARHDGCFYDPKSGKITETIQFKLKEEGSRLNYDQLTTWSQKYCNLDSIDIGFKSSQDLEQSKDLIIKINEFSSLEGFKLFFTATDYSLYKSEHTCRPDIKDILETQASFNKIVTEVNNKMIDSYGEILTEFTFFP